jgi:transcriptional regulator with XRE-family HTH domain
MVTEDKRLFGERMREARDKAGLTNREISERLAKSEPGTAEWYSEVATLRRNLRRWLRGHNRPGADVAIEYAEVCGVSPSYFHTGVVTDEDVLTPLMRALEGVIDKRVADRTSELREIVQTLPSTVHPMDAVGQACAYAHGRVIVAKAEASAGAFAEAKKELDAAIARLRSAVNGAKAAA